jgi:hypothetical protein
MLRSSNPEAGAVLGDYVDGVLGRRVDLAIALPRVIRVGALGCNIVDTASEPLLHSRHARNPAS